jgi:Zn-dependent M16 (insulinase) family peptidase
VFLSWLCGDISDPVETLSLAALAEILLGHDGSPLTRTLVDSGLGEDLSPVTGLEGEIRETVFSAGLRGVEGKEKEVEALILGELEALAREGIPKEEIEAALLSMEFSHREIRRSGGPFSLVWMRRSLRSWLHGGTPWDSLLFVPAFRETKKNLAADPRYFETMIRKYFLDNPHRAFIVIKPEKGFLEKKEAELARILEEKDAALSGAERKAIREKAAELTRIQEKEDNPEALAAIPHLSRQDLSPEIERTPREFYDASGIPVAAHPLFTNGISYADLAFPVDILEPADYPWLPFFSRAVVSMGLPGMDYGEVSSLLARTAGGFHAVLQTGSVVPGVAAAAALPPGILDIGGRDWLIYRLKALDEKIGPSLDLALRLIAEADFTDLRRIRDLLLEMKNDMDSSLAPAGHSYAQSRSGRSFSRSRMTEEIWGGLEQLLFVRRVTGLDTGEISRQLISIRDRLLRGGLLVNLCGSASAIKAALGETGSRFGPFGPPRTRNPAAGTLSGLPGFSAAPVYGPEVFASPSLQVGFAAVTFPAAPYGSPEQAAELVLAHQLSTGALWENIRMKGGAYGAFAQPDHLEGAFSLSTYRDPNPLRSLEAFSSIIKELSEQEPGSPEEEAVHRSALDKAVIGSYARETRPRTSAEKSSADFLRFLYGIEDRHRSLRLKSLIAVTEEEISAALKRLSAAGSLVPQSRRGFPVIIAGKAEAEKAAARLGTKATELPV